MALGWMALGTWALGGLGIVGGGVGCRSTTPVDPVERAKTIHSLNLEGIRLVDEVKQDVRQRDMHHPTLDLHMKKLLDASRALQRSVDLSPTSARPCLLLAECEQLIGFVYLFEFQGVEDQITAEQAAGRVPASRMTARRDELWQKVQDHLGRSNREYHRFASNMYTGIRDRQVYEQLRRNYEELGQWDNALRAGQLFLRESIAAGTAPPEDRRPYENMLQRYKEQIEAAEAEDR